MQQIYGINVDYHTVVSKSRRGVPSGWLSFAKGRGGAIENLPAEI
jgi:hypothetical protein